MKFCRNWLVDKSVDLALEDAVFRAVGQNSSVDVFHEGVLGGLYWSVKDPVRGVDGAVRDASMSYLPLHPGLQDFLLEAGVETRCT